MLFCNEFLMEKEGLWPYLHQVLFLCFSHLSAVDSLAGFLLLVLVLLVFFLLVCISLTRCSSRFITCLTEVLTCNLSAWCIECSIKNKVFRVFRVDFLWSTSLLHCLLTLTVKVFFLMPILSEIQIFLPIIDHQQGVFKMLAAGIQETTWLKSLKYYEVDCINTMLTHIKQKISFFLLALQI